jgi:hypothetical protein
MSVYDDKREMMGALGRDWIALDFGWVGIAARMTDFYARFLGHGDRPEYVEAT